MIIAGVLPLYPPKSRVGAWLTTHEYLAALAKSHTVNVVSYLSRQPEYEIDGVHVHPNYADVERPDLVVSHIGGTTDAGVFAQRWDVPSIRFVHGHDTDNALRLDRYPTALAIFSSQALATDTAWSGNQVIAHPPVCAEDYRTTPGECVTLSNLSAEKGGPELRKIAQHMPETKFLGVRGGWGRQVTNMPENVEMIEPVEDMRTVYARTRILLMPSDRESYGRCAVEAACSGIPTIAHPSPGLREAMGDSAIWKDKVHLGDWITAIKGLESPERWLEASERAWEHSRGLAPDETIAKVVDAIEAVAKVAA